MHPFSADLHVHTVLSPCARFDMVPGCIVSQAREVGLDIIAVTDHNSAENAGAVMQAAARCGLVVLPGLEVETREEVHVLTLFPTLAQALRWQQEVYDHLPDLPNDEPRFGVQVLVDSEDEPSGVFKRRLLTATRLSLEQVFIRASATGGFCLPAHIDRPAYGLLGVLGFIPESIDAPAVEVSAHCRGLHSSLLGGRRTVRSSDAHSLEAVGRARSTFYLAAPSFDELVLACRGLEGRWLVAD